MAIRPGDRGSTVLTVLFGCCAVLFCGFALMLWQSNEPLRPDSGYVVAQPDDCTVEIAAEPDGQAEWTATTRVRTSGRFSSSSTCYSWDVGTMVWFSKDNPRNPVGADPNKSNDRVGAGVMAGAALITGGYAIWYLVGGIKARRRTGS